MLTNSFISERLRTVILLLALLISWFPRTGNAQSVADTSQSEKVVRKIRFIGNESIADKKLESLTRTRTNREFLGIPRFTPWYFLWKINHKIGEPPSRLNRSVVGTDIERITTYYKSNGYQDVSVDTNIVPFGKNKAEVTFQIREGPLYQLNHITYAGTPSFADQPGRRKAFYEQSELTRKKVNDSTFLVNRRFTYDLLTKERNRILNYLKNNGYASIQRDSVIAQVKKDTAKPYQFDVQFRINPGKIYYFGDVFISLAGPDNTVNYEASDTLHYPSHAGDKNKTMVLQKEYESHTKLSLLRDQVLFEPGQLYNHSLYMRTINEFQNLGMLNIQQFGLSREGGLPDYSRTDLPVMFRLKTRPRHQLSMEMFGMERYGFGAGAGITYTNNNLFGRAEQIQLSLNGNFEYVTSNFFDEYEFPNSDTTFSYGGDQLFQSFQAQIDYSEPRLNFPFSWLDQQLFFSNSRTRYSLVYSQSNQINFNINADIRFNLSYTVDHNDQFSSQLDLIELDWLDTTPSGDFLRSLEEQYGKGSLELKRIREDFRPQFSSSIRYTFRDITTNLIKRNYGHYAEYSFSIAGNFPYLLDRYVVTPNTLEGNLPSLFRISTNSLSYTRFFKLSADYRKYIQLSDDATFGYRLFGGFAHPYGKNKDIPLNRRFFAGGSNDIRGWPPYRLGPGGISSNRVAINGGEIKLAAFSEFRQLLISNFLSANWLGAWFVDMGNVWYGPETSIQGNVSQNILERGKFYYDEFYKQIAVGSGVGLRLDWEFVVLRLDLSNRIHDLENGWFKDKGLYFSFGVGHSF